MSVPAVGLDGWRLDDPWVEAACDAVASRKDEDWERGKQIQQREPGTVPWKSELETATGQYARLAEVAPVPAFTDVWNKGRVLWALADDSSTDRVIDAAYKRRGLGKLIRVLENLGIYLDWDQPEFRLR